MHCEAIAQDINQVKAGALVINLFEGVTHPGGATGAADQAMGGAIAKLIQSGEITGKRGELTVLHVFGQIAADHIAVLGLGPRDRCTYETIRASMAEASRGLRRIGVTRIATILHGAGPQGAGLDNTGGAGMQPRHAAQAIAEGVVLGLYEFRKLGNNGAGKHVDSLVIVEHDPAKIDDVQRGMDAGRIIAQSVCLARDLANTPANLMTPAHLAEAAARVAAEAGLGCTILERTDMERLGMGALLGVAQGSVQPPKFITLTYAGDPANRAATLGLVGKGVTFDSGGISLKPAGGMSDMKTDMSGGATVIAAMRAIGLLKPAINVTALVPAAENMPSGAAIKPGDVLTAMNGKTIEVENTDAEGRLLLADALSYGNTLRLSPMLDVATLTGAISTTFGKVCTGVFTNHQPTLDRLMRASQRTGEKIWQLPLFDEYRDLFKSDVANLKNTGGRSAGAITAAMFLAEFAAGTPWVHLDIAGTARADAIKGYLIKGASGVPVRTLVQFVLDSAASPPGETPPARR